MARDLVLSLTTILLLFCRHVVSAQDIPDVVIPNPDQGQEQDLGQLVPPTNSEDPPHDGVVTPPPDSNENQQGPGRDHHWNGYHQHCQPTYIPMPGPAGPSGPQGPPGATGPAGMPGNHGNNGNNGASGLPGPEGMKGQKGEHGYPGITGRPGTPGSTGASGPRGAPGFTGERGPPGAAGKHGLAGVTGLKGQRGIQGLPGEKGDMGDTGPSGADGECSCERQERPRLSAFSVARTTGLVATDGPVAITFQHVFTNIGDDFNVNTGKFNCSVPGAYFFSINVYKSSTQNFPLVQILLNGEHVAAVIDYGTSDSEDSTSNSVILNLNRGDLVWLQLFDGRELYSSHYRFTTFSGFRLG